MKLPLNKCIPGEWFISIDAVEEAVLALSLGERLVPVEYQRLPSGHFLIRRGCSQCAGAALTGAKGVDGVRTHAPLRRFARFLKRVPKAGRRAFLMLPVAETAPAGVLSSMRLGASRHAQTLHDQTLAVAAKPDS